MATFAVPQEENVELAGPTSDLVGRLIAVKPLSRDFINVATEYGASPALRCLFVDLESGENAGVRLVFWTTTARQILDATTGAPWAVGTIEHKAQVNDPTRSVYLFSPPDMSEIDPDSISDTIDAATAPF